MTDVYLNFCIAQLCACKLIYLCLYNNFMLLMFILKLNFLYVSFTDPIYVQYCKTEEIDWLL